MADTAAVVTQQQQQPSALPAIARLQQLHLQHGSGISNRSDSSSQFLTPPQHLSRQSSSVPEIIVFAPEEELEDPSISYAPNDYLSGLPNPLKTRVTSLMNSVIQTFIALPEITDELPAASTDPNIAQFVASVRRLHCDAEKVATPDMFPLDWLREIAHLPSLSSDSNGTSSALNHSSGDGDVVMLEKDPNSLATANSTAMDMASTLTLSLSNSSQTSIENLNPSSSHPDDNKFESILNYPAVIEAMVETILAPCRIGKRFHYETTLVSTSPVVVSDNTPSYVVQRKASSPTRRQRDLILNLQLGNRAETETVGLITLIQEFLGISAGFFFGNSSPMTTRAAASASTVNNGYKNIWNASADWSMGSPQKQQQPQQPQQQQQQQKPKQKSLFTHLPSLLTVTLHRPKSSSSTSTESLHRTAVELPMDLDLGFALDPKRPRPIPTNPSASTANPPSTFYKLHGFITQIDGKFLCYTRLRGGNGWFKCEDEVVAEADLGARVCSKGVVAALYRLQIAKR